MKKGKVTMVITAGIVCFILAIVMTMQFKIVNETDITAIENMRETELKAELANWKEKYDETNQKYEETVQKINEYKEKQQFNIEANELMEEELEQAEMTMGKTDVEGSGIEITLRDSDNEEIRNIEDDDLILIINYLKSAGAEAISINGERIIAMSDIVSIKDEYIKINLKTKIESPYIIKAIGEPSYLESSLIGNGGQVDKLRKEGHDISITKSNKITINKYNGEIKTKYIVD